VDNKVAFLKFDETLQRDVIQFEGYFGQYWPVVISRPLTVAEVPAAKESIIPIVNKGLATVITSAGVVNESVIVKTQAVVALKIEKVGLVLDLNNRSFTVNAEIDKNFASCKVDVSENIASLKTSTFDTDANFSYTAAISKATAHQLFARYRCLDTNGKMIISAWSDAVTVPVLPFASTAPGTTPGASSGTPTPGAGSSPAHYSKVTIADDGYINDSEKALNNAVWAVFDTSGGSISFSPPLSNNSNTLVCDASQAYTQSLAPRALDLPSDGAWSACARIQASDGTAIFVKADTVIRDTVYPTFTSLLAINGASDGYINNNERISTAAVWSLQASNYDALGYSVAMSDVGGSLPCDSTVNYSSTSIPTIASITSDGAWAMCVMLKDNAGNKSYGKSVQVNRKTPIFTLGFAGLNTIDQSPPLMGTVSIPDASISVQVNGSVYGASNNANGTWTIADNVLSNLPHNYYDVTVSATDVAGNTATLDSPQSLKIISDKFITTWKTDNAGTSSSTQIKLPLESNGTYNFTVDWGDSTTDTITSFNATAATHNYSAAGTYTVRITGNLTGWRFVNAGDKLKLLNISAWGPFRFGNDDSYFQGASNLTITATDRPDITGTTRFNAAFAGCASLTTIPNLEKWNMGNVTSIERMFRDATQFNQNLNAWNLTAVTDFREVFAGATLFNGNISAWDVSNGTLFNGMFIDALAFNQDISSWNLSSATSLMAMFQGTRAFNKNLNSWNVANV
ncbi:MAG: BspA family leucine-rich repeat surface protein, partial [Proteobacteria bacterium]